MTDDELDLWLGDARDLIDADIARERRDVAPDFVALIEAAHAAALVDDAALREVAEFAPIVALTSEEPHDAGEFDARLAQLLDDVREQVETDVAHRRLAGIPPLRSASPEPSRSRGPRLGLMLVAAAAILVGLAIALPRLLESMGGEHEATQINNQAEYRRDEVHGEREALPRPMPHELEPQAAIVHEGGEPEVAVPDQAERRATTKQPRQRSRDTDLSARVAELEQRARAHWQAGELREAEARYREIIGIAGRSRYADLAFGDLFTLAHQRKDSAAELALWQEYLAVFPRGRFVEDARAGICRRADASAQPGCWRAYLDDFPRGLHAARAQRELGEAP